MDGCLVSKIGVLLKWYRYIVVVGIVGNFVKFYINKNVMALLTSVLQLIAA